MTKIIQAVLSALLSTGIVRFAMNTAAEPMSITLIQILPGQRPVIA
jgi:hypothetical protein